MSQPSENLPKISAEFRRDMLLLQDKKELIVCKPLHNSVRLSSAVSLLQKQHPYITVRWVNAQEYEAIRRELPDDAELKSKSDAIETAMSLFREAARQGATDIHISENRDSFTQIEFRVDDLMFKYSTLRSEQAEDLITVIYGFMTSDADPTYMRDTPQSGRISASKYLPPHVYSIRIQHAPTTDGDYMVLRLQYDDSIIQRRNERIDEKEGDLILELGSMGYLHQQRREIHQMSRQPAGMVVIAGPTGSGKSTTLKKIMQALKKENPGKNIISIEDPPEFPIEDVKQLPVTNAQTQQERGEKFLSVFASTLRMDPNTLMPGEIRDSAIAMTAVEAANTGHQVWTTLHASGPFQILTRLANLLSGPDRPDPWEYLADTNIIVGLMSQRLAPLLCPHCKAPYAAGRRDLLNDVRDRIDGLYGDFTDQIYLRGKGCANCKGTGRKGRIVVAETVRPSAELLEVMRAGGSNAARRYWRESLGGITLLQTVSRLVLRGEVCPDMMDTEVVMLENTENVKLDSEVKAAA